MARRLWTAVAIAAVCVAGATGVAALDSTAGTVLVVTDAEGTELLVTPVDDRTEVVVAYTHSVERTPVRDVYVPADGRLRMTRMEFRSYGAGLPSTVAVETEGDHFVYRPEDRTYGTLRVTTGHVADHDLVVGETRYDLATMADGGTVELRLERRYLLAQ